MQEAFPYVMVAVVLVAIVAAIVSLRGDRYDHIGRGGLFEERTDGRPAAPPPAPAVARAEADEEVRQMLAARNSRRLARGEAELDLDAEVARLTGATAAADPALVAEVRHLVERRNARRVRRGEAPLDVEAEVARQLRDLASG